jgi:hypothetical protein
VFNGSFPTANVFLDEGLKTPSTREFTLQAGTRLGQRGEVKAIYTSRRMDNLLEDFITIEQGRTTVTEGGRSFGPFDNAFVTNSDVAFRKFDSMQLVSSYRVSDKVSMWAHYTMQLKNEGNFEGEAANQPGNYSIIDDRPEIISEQRHFPGGRLAQFQRHKVVAALNLGQTLGRAGTVNLGLGYRYDSPLTFSFLSASVPATATQRAAATAAGYAGVFTSQTIYYEGRGTGEFEAAHLVSLALNYDVPLWKSVRPYVKFDLRNVFNSQPLIGFDTTLIPNNSGPTDALGIPTTYTQGPNFGKNTVLTHNPVPREYRVSLGFRF